MIRLLHLHADEVEMLERLDDGFPEEDHVGIPSDQLTAAQVRAWEALWQDGLADYTEGRHGTMWLRLTERGRELKTKGSVL
ncbi:hypothetical protein [Aureimonas psammosilenae]|uniref:hypothetical protein n=1 Tax=Aureimonas psammosilenae TaxID=2495496 RepID=UPI0012609A6B|nr:hypothetical protein [Aureimonas psammosilenae]